MRETVIKQGPGLGGLVAARAAYMLMRTLEVKFLSFLVVIHSLFSIRDSVIFGLGSVPYFLQNIA